MQSDLPDAITEAGALRAIDWPVSRRMELRGLLPSIPVGQARIYQRTAVERLASMSPAEREELRQQGALFTRNGTAAEAPPAEIHTRAAEFTRAAIDVAARTVELSFSSEAPVSRWFGNEILDHASGSVRLGRLNNGGALLLDHDPSKQIGVVVSARIDPDGKGRAKVRFGTSALANEIFKDVQDGIRRLVSVGYRIHKQVTEGKSGGVETVRVTDWEPYELSLVSIPADDSVGVGRGIELTPGSSIRIESSTMNRNQIIAALRAANIQFDEALSDDQLRSLLPSTQAAAERSRISSIQAIGGQLAERQGLELDVAAAIRDGVTASEFQQRAFEALISRQTAYNPPMPAGPFGSASRSERRDLEQYSIVRAIRQASAGRLDGLEAEVSRELARTALAEPAGFLVPHSALVGRGMSVTGDSGVYGGETVATVKMGFIDALRKRLAVAEMGATMMSGLTSNVSIPRQVAGSSASWKAEIAELDEQTPEIDDLELTPHRLGAFTILSKQLIAQASLDVESLVRNDLMQAIAIAFDAAAINGSGSANQPTGILATSGIGSVVGGANGAAPEWADLVNLVAAVANADALQGRTGFLFSTKVESFFRQTLKVDSTDSKMILEEGQTTLSGHRWQSTNNVPDNLTKGDSTGVCSAIIFGNFADLILASFGSAVDLVVDPFTLATSGRTRIIATSLVDVGVRRASSFAAMKDALAAIS